MAINVKQFILLVFILLLGQSAYSQKVPSSLAVFQSFDNDENRNTALDFIWSTPFYALIHGGSAYSRLQFDDETTGKNSTYYLGIQSNPLRDWIFGFNYSYTNVSEQMKIFNSSIFIQKYFNHWNLRLDVGSRLIETEITTALQNLFQTADDTSTDENPWWALALEVDITPQFSLMASYRQFQYTLNFGFFNTAVAQPFGYDLDTINYGATFPDNIVSVGGNVYLRRWDLGLEYQFINNEFDDTKTTTIIPSAGFHLNKKWFFNLSLGFSRGVTEDEEDTVGRFLGLGTTFSF